MKCPKCGAEVEDTARFCNRCGYPLTGAAKEKPKVRVVEGAKDAAPSDDIDAAVHKAAQERNADQTCPMPASDATNPQADAASGNDAATRIASGPMAKTVQVEEPPTQVMDYETYITAPATEAVFQPEEETDPSMGLDRIDAEDLGSDATATELEPLAVPAEDVPADGAPSDAQDLPASIPQEAPDDAQRRKRGRRTQAIIMAIAAAILAFALGWYGYQQEWWGGVTVPDVTGMQVDEATRTLQDAGFAVDVQLSYVDSGDGYVLAMVTPAGGRMARGSTVSIDVGQLRTIPDVVGMAKDDAVAALAEIGASSFHYEYKNSSEAEDTVLAVNPAAGSTFSSSDTITLTLAQGYQVPDLIGMTESAAVAALKKAGLAANVVYVEAERMAGTVDSTDPAAGTAVSAGTTVTLNVAQGSDAEAASSLSNANHVADYFSATSQDVASFLEQQGFALVYGARDADGYAECTYTKEYAGTLAFTSHPHTKAQTSGSAEDVLSEGATIAGVQLTLDGADVGAGAVSQDGLSAVMGACGLSSAEATVSSSSSSSQGTTSADASSQTTDASKGASSSSSSSSVASDGSSSASNASSATAQGWSYICAAGESGDLVWTVLLYQQSGSPSVSVAVTCGPKDFYTGKGLSSMEEIARYAATTYLG